MRSDNGRSIAFDPLKRPVWFENGAEKLLDWLPSLSSGWSFREAGSESLSAPRLVVKIEADHYRIDAPWLDNPVREADPFRAAANLAVDLLEACLDENPDLLTVHCATAEIEGRAVLFPASSRAGKSTLAARLAAEGLPILGDDVIALTGEDPPMAVSFGLFPRLRLPLPVHASEVFRQFVESRSSAKNGKYSYLNLPEELAPRFGDLSPLGAVVLLDRDTENDCSLSRIGPGDGLQELLMQNLSPSLAMVDALPRLVKMLTDVPCLRLTYWDLDEAAARLGSLFTDLAAARPDSEREPIENPNGAAPYQLNRIRHLVAGTRFLRCASVMREEVEDGAFLVDRRSGSVFRLNSISNALWTLMEEPMTAVRIVSVLKLAYPNTDWHRLLADVESHLVEMLEAGLIGNCGAEIAVDDGMPE